MTYRKKLIEVALPLEAINAASAREKSIRHGHPSTLHLWWARRPLAAARAVIFTSLVDDPDDPESPPAFIEACLALPMGKNAADHDTPRMRLFDFIELLVKWESTTDEQVLETARELIRLCTDGNPPPLLDPFAGGGSIPLEAQRLGLEAHASDLNPVAVMINKAMIEIPPRFANQPPANSQDRARVGGTSQWKGASGLAADVRYYGQWMRDRAWEKIGHLYPQFVPPASSRPAARDGGAPETVIAWLWARTVKCPNPACGANMPLVSSFWLSKKKGKQAWVEPVVDMQAKTVQFTVKSGKGKAPDPPKVSRGAKFRCLVCSEVAPTQYLKDEGMAGRMDAQLMAIVTEGKRCRNYHAPTTEHVSIAQQAKPSWKPVGELANEPRAIWCKLYGLIDFADLFTPRQLVSLTTFSDLVGEARAQIEQDALAAGLGNDETPLRDGGTGAKAYAEAVNVYLSMTVSRQSNRLSSICFWDTSGEKVQQVFARQAIPMNWDYTEANPFSDSSGNFIGQLGYLARVVDAAPANQTGSGWQQDARQPLVKHAECEYMISTDPPYYDNIGYADLSDYFYVWLRPSLKTILPEAFGTMLTPKNSELIASSYRHDGDKVEATKHFEDGFVDAFTNFSDIIIDDYPLSLFYAFKQSEADVLYGNVKKGVSNTGWETMLQGLITAGFEITGTWPVRTEFVRGLKKRVNALASSIVLVCRLRTKDAAVTSRRAFVAELRREIPAALKEMQSGNIAPVDLAQASIGPGMAVYSKYRQVLEANGEKLTVRTALQLINQVLDAYLAEQEGDLDGDSRFAVAWFEQYGFKEGQFGTADVLARAKNTSVDGLVQAGVIQSGAGKVRLLSWQEMDPGWDPAADKRRTVWEATHHLIERLNVHGEEGAALLLAKMPAELAADARALAYRLYSICERKGWAEQARDYNALVISWGASQERAAQVRTQATQGRLFE